MNAIFCAGAAGFKGRSFASRSVEELRRISFGQGRRRGLGARNAQRRPHGGTDSTFLQELNQFFAKGPIILEPAHEAI